MIVKSITPQVAPCNFQNTTPKFPIRLLAIPCHHDCISKFRFDIFWRTPTIHITFVNVIKQKMYDCIVELCFVKIYLV